MSLYRFFASDKEIPELDNMHVTPGDDDKSPVNVTKINVNDLSVQNIKNFVDKNLFLIMNVFKFIKNIIINIIKLKLLQKAVGVLLCLKISLFLCIKNINNCILKIDWNKVY